MTTRVLSPLSRKTMALERLLAVQRDSWNWFWTKGVLEIFEEISPITDYSGKEFELSFLQHRLADPPFDELEAREHNASYEATLRVRTRLRNIKTGEAKEQEVYLGEFPLMTPRGTFVVNGVERVIIPQLIRSPGVFFAREFYRGMALFGAKIIPNRGAWLEFDTDPRGVIGVKIDRKRRIPATTLLRAFGISPEELSAFVAAEDSGEVRFLKETLKRDTAQTHEEALMEVYKRVRPGDLATSDNARSLFVNMFQTFGRYDLARVGRWKMEMRLEEQAPKEEAITKAMRLLSKNDVLRIFREIILLNNTQGAAPDEVDHLGNRRVRAIGELLQQRLRAGFSRMERIVKDRMSTLDPATITPMQLVNARPVAATVREFFSSSQLSQFMDNVNPLAELEHKRRVSAMGPGGLTRERAGFEVRDVQPSHYGRICPIQTPEGPNIGLVGHLAAWARLNSFGFIESPYFRVTNTKVTDEVAWLDAATEQRHVIAHAGIHVDLRGKIADERVEARVYGEPTLVARNEVEFIDVAPQQALSIAAGLIPFLEHDDPTRAMMGANMQRQAVPCVHPEKPLVSTGFEEAAARESGQAIEAEEDGVVAEADASHIVISGKKKKYHYSLKTFLRTNQYTTITQKPRVTPGQRVRKGEVIADGAAMDEGVLALGQNLLVAFLPWRGWNYEDAIIISERVVEHDRFTSVHVEDFVCDVRETKLGPEMTTPDIPNVGEEKLKDLDEMGIVRIGAEVRPGSLLVGKITPKGETDLTAEERLLRSIFGEKARDVKDTSLRLPHGKRGRVIEVKIFDRAQGDSLPPGVIIQVQIEIAYIRPVVVGDKLAGRHGNKGVISKVLPVEEMPFLDDGTPVDIVLNPLGVASRMNIGQILETHLGFAAKYLGVRAITPALSGASEEDIKTLLREAGFSESEKLRLRDGRTGKPFPNPVTVGYIYMMKLVHMVEDKIHMRAVGPYSLITQQPLSGKAQMGGQRFGEMEVWALEGYGVAHNLQEMLTVKSDDVLGRSALYEAIVRGQPLRTPNIPSSFNVLLAELRALGMSADLLGLKEPPRKRDEESR